MGNQHDVFVKAIRNEIRLTYSQLYMNKIIIFGSGSFGTMIFEEFERIGLDKNVVAFADTRKERWGKKVKNITIFSVEELVERYPDAYYVVESSYWRDMLASIPTHIRKRMNLFDQGEFLRLLEYQLYFIYVNRDHDCVSYADYWFGLYDELYMSGRLNKYVSEVSELMSDEKSRDIIQGRIEFFLSGDIEIIRNLPYDSTMYFNRDYYSISDEEVYFDCGSFRGEDIENFITITGGKYNRIIGFEPDESNCHMIQTRLAEKEQNSRIQIYPYAVGSSHDKVRFSNGASGDSHIINNSSEEGIIIDTIMLDDYIDYCPTLIKMDIEGAEMAALIGAKKTIENLTPKLAVSIYHKYLDFYELPILLKKLVPDYRFKVRHHSIGLYDTVLYAEL